MKSLLVTGANGFIGKNLVASLERAGNVDVFKFDIDNLFIQLEKYTTQADFVFHLAGANRPKDAGEFEHCNIGFTDQLLDLLRRAGRNVPVLFSSSIQAAMDNPYGNSKKKAEESLLRYEQETGARVCVYRLPNVFGKWCRPYYNSVVATWCYNIARDMPIQINNPDAELELAYIDDVVEEFCNAMEGKENRKGDGFCYVRRTFTLALQHLADTLHSFRNSRKTLVVPDFDDDLRRFLYATYTSYLPEKEFGYALEMKHDHRGWLTEFIKSKNFGQIFISRTKPGVTRGNHWHHTKIEKFMVIEGDALIRFRQINGFDIVEYTVSGKRLEVLDIPAGYTHSITNIGRHDVLTLFWSDEIFDAQKSDTYAMNV